MGGVNILICRWSWMPTSFWPGCNYRQVQLTLLCRRVVFELLTRRSCADDYNTNDNFEWRLFAICICYVYYFVIICFKWSIKFVPRVSHEDTCFDGWLFMRIVLGTSHRYIDVWQHTSASRHSLFLLTLTPPLWHYRRLSSFHFAEITAINSDL